MKIIVLGLLLLGCFLLFSEGRLLQGAGELLEKTKWGIDTASRQRVLESKRRNMQQRDRNIWTKVERELFYSGIKLRFPKVTAESWGALNLAACAVLLTVAGSVWGIGYGLMAVCGFALLEKWVLGQMKLHNLKMVNESLLKLLDFLGNYSITSGEVTGVLFQVSRYMEEPLKSVLEECCYEAQTTGDVSTALLAMAEKVEHPKFKELVGNMEISIRYCADFTALVSGSKRTMREYLRSAGERKGMLREAVISMVLLLGMSFIILLAVGSLVHVSAAELLVDTWPGKGGLMVIGGVGILFLSQLRRIHY